MTAAGKDPRRSVLSLLLQGRENGGYANLAVQGEEMTALPPRERAFATALFYGVTERRLTLEYYTGVLTARSPDALSAHTAILVQMGLYQLLYMGGIPPHAAVYETVALAENPGEAALVNAALRRALREAAALVPPPRTRDLCRHLSIAYSIPRPTVKYFLGRLGEKECEAFLAACNRKPPLSLRVNTLRIGRREFLERLTAAGYEAHPDPLSAYGIELVGPAAPAELPGYPEGLFFVQDTASQLEGAVLAPLPGEKILDLCACPGGKSFGAAIEMRDDGRVEARDLHASKLPLIRTGAERLGLTAVHTKESDATQSDPADTGAFDRVICDVPCSGLGVLAKKPDLRYRGFSGQEELIAVQRRILENAARAVRPGGVLVYSTCTLTQEENEEAVAFFLSSRPDFSAEDFSVGGLTSSGGMLTLWPHIHHTDGFFLAKLRRI